MSCYILRPARLFFSWPNIVITYVTGHSVPGLNFEMIQRIFRILLSMKHYIVISSFTPKLLI